MNEFANSFSWRLSLERQVRPIFVVFGLPSLQLSSEISFMLEMPSLIELLGVGLVASLDLPVHLWAARRNVLVGNAEIRKMSGELRPNEEPLSVWIL